MTKKVARTWINIVRKALTHRKQPLGIIYRKVFAARTERESLFINEITDAAKIRQKLQMLVASGEAERTDKGIYRLIWLSGPCPCKKAVKARDRKHCAVCLDKNKQKTKAKAEGRLADGLCERPGCRQKPIRGEIRCSYHKEQNQRRCSQWSATNRAHIREYELNQRKELNRRKCS